MITDKFGRKWEYWKGEYTPIFTHCGMAWTEEAIKSPMISLPSESVRNNPNYRLCSICKGL